MNGKIKQRRALVFIVHVEDDVMPTLKTAVIESFEHHIQELRDDEGKERKSSKVGRKGKRQINPTTNYEWQTLTGDDANPDVRHILRMLAHPMMIYDPTEAINLDNCKPGGLKLVDTIEDCKP